ncbi:MAG: hypothetical protein H6672_04930 [Anaerolineaceae bacterium]|nr:hypothetical protein [Anaerolineaceae bacterium]
MTTWIGHLRIAENLLPHLPLLDERLFLFGSLAPDSGVPNADWTQFDPPKEVTHFLEKGLDEGNIKDLHFYRAYLAGVSPDDTRYSYLLGYFFHLICDNLWSIRVGRPTRERLADMIAELGESEVIRRVKNDWYTLDFKYVRDHPDCAFWRVYRDAPPPPAVVPYLSDAALHQQITYIRDFYCNPPDDLVIERAYPYLNEAHMARYVEEAAALLLRIHDCIRDDGTGTGHTALKLLPDFTFTPYPAPLGDQ